MLRGLLMRCRIKFSTSRLRPRPAEAPDNTDQQTGDSYGRCSPQTIDPPSISNLLLTIQQHTISQPGRQLRHRSGFPQKIMFRQ